MLKYLVFVFTSAILFYSCTLVTEPDRIYNNKAAPPELISYNFNQLFPGQHVDGTIKVTFNSKDLNNQKVSIKVYIDSLSYGNIYSLPLTLEINTRKYSEGPHNIFFFVYQKGNNIGLMNFLKAPTKIYGTYLYFDRTPPDQVNLSVSVDNNKTRELTWTKSNSSNFYAYIIYRSIGNFPFVPIDTVYDINTTSCKDSTNSDLLGVKFQYKVAVTTDYKFAYKTNSLPAECILGNPIRYNYEQYNSGPYLDETFSRIYYIADNKLVEFSSNNLSHLGDLDLNGLMASGTDYIVLKFNNDKSRIYLYNRNGYKLWIINSFDLSVIKKMNLPDGGEDLYILDNSRIFFSSYNGSLLINTDNNSVLNKTDHLYAAARAAIVIKDSVKMVAVDNISSGWCLDMIDIRSSSFEIMYRVNTYDRYDKIKMAGNKLYCDAKSIYDANTLSFLGNLNINGFIDSYAVTNDLVAVESFSQYHLSGSNSITCEKVSVYNDNSKKLMQVYVDTNNTLAIDKENIYTGPSRNGNGPANVLGYSIKYGK